MALEITNYWQKEVYDTLFVYNSPIIQSPEAVEFITSQATIGEELYQKNLDAGQSPFEARTNAREEMLEYIIQLYEQTQDN